MLNEKYQALLDQYDISVSHTRRGRGCVLCFGENDVYALSQTSLSEERLGAVSEWTLAMHDHHFYKTQETKHTQISHVLFGEIIICKTDDSRRVFIKI